MRASCVVVSAIVISVFAASCGGGESSSTGSGGAAGSASTSGTGGTAGATGVGGATGGAGGAGTGGSSGDGGTTGAGGGAGAGGAGGAPGSGGVTGAGGSAGGATGTGGAGGAAANDPTIAGTFDGALLGYPCGATHTGYDCDNVGCTNAQVTHTQTFRLGGAAGTVYNMTFRVRGVVEAYNYVGGTRDAANASITSNLDLFLQGGMPQAPGANGYDYNTYELDVSPPVAGAPNTYFFNSVVNADNPHTSVTTQHLTFAIDYTKTIKVAGGGTLTFKTFDSNCRSVMNCGPTQGNTCVAPRSVTLSGAMPAPPASFMQPYQMPTGAYGQWLFFDVNSVTAAN